LLFSLAVRTVASWWGVIPWARSVISCALVFRRTSGLYKAMIRIASGWVTSLWASSVSDVAPPTIPTRRLPPRRGCDPPADGVAEVDGEEPPHAAASPPLATITPPATPPPP